MGQAVRYSNRPSLVRASQTILGGNAPRPVLLESSPIFWAVLNFITPTTRCWKPRCQQMKMMRQRTGTDKTRIVTTSERLNLEVIAAAMVQTRHVQVHKVVASVGFEPTTGLSPWEI